MIKINIAYKTAVFNCIVRSVFYLIHTAKCRRTISRARYHVGAVVVVVATVVGVVVVATVVCVVVAVVAAKVIF